MSSRLPRSRRWSIALLALASLAAAPATRPATTQPAAQPPAVDSRAADFTLETLDGQPVTLSKANADGPVVLVMLRGYPGYQCPICTKQVAELTRSADAFAAEKARVILVYPGPAENLKDRAAEFAEGKALPEGFTFVTDPDYALTNAYGLRWDAPGETAYPASFVIDAAGVVRYAKISQSHGGRAATSEIVAAVKKS